MKKLLLTACAVACAASVFAQGTVQFNNRISGSIVTHVYLSPASVSSPISGNGAGDTPAGTTDWAGFTALSGTGYKAALAVNWGGSGAPTVWGDLIQSFRTGTGAGFTLAPARDAVLPGVAVNTSAKINMFAWDASNISEPAAAYAAWQSGVIAAGFSKAVTITAGGNDGINPPLTAPQLAGLESFNIYMIPEPSSLALAGLGAAAMLIFRRRK